MDTVPNLSVSATGSIVQLWKSVIRCSHECQWVVIAHDFSTWSQFVSSGSSQSFRRLEAMEQRLLALEKVLMSEPIESLQEANVGLTADLLCFLMFFGQVRRCIPEASRIHVLDGKQTSDTAPVEVSFCFPVNTSDIRYHFAVEIPLHQKRFAHTLKDSLSISL